MKKKFISLFLTAVMATSLLAGCGNSGTTAPAESKPAETPAAATEEAKAETTPAESTAAAETTAESGSADYSGVTLTMWSMWNSTEPQGQVIQEAADAFKEKTGATINIEWKGRDINTIIQAALESNEKIDIFEDDYSRIAKNYKDYCYDLTDMAKAANYDATSYACFNEVATEWAGFLPCVTEQPQVGGVFYNQDIFDDCGISVPTTWDEFLDCCQKIKDAGYDPITVDDAYQQSMYGHYLAMIKDVDWVGELLTDKTGKLWDDPAILQMAEDFQELREKGYFAKSVGSNVFPAAQNGEFAMGTAAMYYNGSWLPNEVAEITGDDFQWGAMFFPAPEGSKYPYTTYTTGCQFYGVNKDCEHPEEAVALLAEFTSVKTQQALADEAQCIPVINGITLPDNLVCVGELMEESTDAFVWGGSNLEDADVRAIINASFTKLLAGDIDAPKFVEEIKSQLK
mgnify:CR=1 FL=1